MQLLTRAQLDAAALAGTLAAGEPYLITDEDRIAVGLTSSTYQDYALAGEGGAASLPSNYIRFDRPWAYCYRNPANFLELILSAGEAMVDGNLVSWPETTVPVGNNSTIEPQIWHLTVSASGQFLIDNNELAYEDTEGYAVVSGNRWLLSFAVYGKLSVPRVIPFTAQCVAGISRVVYQGEYTAPAEIDMQGGSFNVVTGGAAGTFTPFSCAFGPAHAISAVLIVKGVWISGTYDANLMISQSATGATSALSALYPPYSYRVPISTGRVFFGPSTIPIDKRDMHNTNLYYARYLNTGSGTMDVVQVGYEAPL